MNSAGERRRGEMNPKQSMPMPDSRRQEFTGMWRVTNRTAILYFKF